MSKEQFEEVKEQVKAGENPSGFIPTEYKVVMLNDFVESETPGGIALPAQKVEQDQRTQTIGYVCAISDMAFTDGEGNRWPCKVPGVGEKVIFAKYQGQLYDRGGITYRILNDKDIAAIISE